MRCLVVDDETSSRSRLKRLLKCHDDIAIVGEAEDGAAGLEAILQQSPDLVFLDIEMPQLNGIQMLRALPESSPIPLVIFITGYDEHALAAFEANALAYLLKPVEEERLAAALDRARLLLANTRDRQADAENLRDVVAQRRAPMDRIVGKKLDRFYLLRPDEIVFFSAEDGLVKAHSLKESYTVDLPLSDLESDLSSRQFFRANRAALVNLNRIREIQPYFRSSYIILMADAESTQLQVSERQAKQLRSRVPGL
jgi:DNA-binding LytR/AlgR family response regulator